jgi:hypothetical protein
MIEDARNHEREVICWLGERLLACREGLCFMKLISLLKIKLYSVTHCWLLAFPWCMFRWGGLTRVGVCLSWIGLGGGGLWVCHDNSDSKHHNMKKYGDMEAQFHKYLTDIANTNCSKIKVTKKNLAYVCEDRSRQLSGQPTPPRQILQQGGQPECPCRKGSHCRPHCW